ncbi:unnamed protein product [Alopecurus aequalis]
MACPHLAAASSPAATTATLRSRATSAAFARLPATLRSENGGLALRGRRAVAPVVVAAGPASSAPVADLDGRPATVKQPIIVIDNYDSFTYNLCQYMGELGLNFEVYRNDELTIEEVKKKNPRGILISPGPGEPQDSGISLQTVLELGPTIPIFGVCMGLQCIGEAFGGKIIRVPSGVMHGKSSPVYYDEVLGKSIFEGLANPFTAARYHSLVIEKESFPHDALEITAWTEDGLVMAARHKKYKHILVFLNSASHQFMCHLRASHVPEVLSVEDPPNWVISWTKITVVLTGANSYGVNSFRGSSSTRRASSPLKARESSSTSRDTWKSLRSRAPRGSRGSEKQST